MKNLLRTGIKAALGLVLLTSLSGCIGEVVEIPTAHRGIISTSSGLQDDILPPSKMRLSNFCRVCDNLIIAEVSDYSKEETMQLYMPKDKLNLAIEVRGTFATSDSDTDLHMIFDRVTPIQISERVSKIPANDVYNTYARQIIREKVRSVVAKYDIATVMANRDAIGTELRDSVRKALEGRPVKVLNFGLANIQPPDVIVNAEIKRKSREIAINEAEANKQIRLKEAEADLEVAVTQQAVELKEAETQVLVEKKLKEGFSHAYVAQRGLRILEQLAGSNNKVIFLPTEALSNPAVMIGGVDEALSKDETREAVTPASIARQASNDSSAK